MQENIIQYNYITPCHFALSFYGGFRIPECRIQEIIHVMSVSHVIISPMSIVNF